MATPLSEILYPLEIGLAGLWCETGYPFYIGPAAPCGEIVYPFYIGPAPPFCEKGSTCRYMNTIGKKKKKNILEAWDIYNNSY